MGSLFINRGNRGQRNLLDYHYWSLICSGNLYCPPFPFLLVKIMAVVRKVVARTRRAMKADRGRGSQEQRDVDFPEYRNGAEGMIKWVEDNVYAEITPISEDVLAAGDVKVWVPMKDLPKTPNTDTGRSYHHIWEEQKKILRRALVMKNGTFIHRLIVLCWMRGEGKSILACLIQLWKFFCWNRQTITLGANSKDQVKFVHFDIMRDIIRNSPHLKSQVGERNIQEKEIRITNPKNEIISLIRSISSFTGIVSNITGYTFSEMFDMKNPKFFVQLDGSVRNIPNALGVIDSTVSDKSHVLYHLYASFTEGKTTTVFYSYRHSKLGDVDDYWHPLMTKAQLDDYRAKFPFGEFERYFLNLWSAGTTRVFTEEMIEAMSFYSANGRILDGKNILEILEEKNRTVILRNDTIEKNLPFDIDGLNIKIVGLYEKLAKIDDIYSFSDFLGTSKMAVINDLKKLEETFDTHFSLLAGIDRGDPSAVRGKARSIVSVVAKGLPGSRSNPSMTTLLEAAPRYVYFLLLLADIKNHSLDLIKEVLDLCNDEFDGIDALCSERYGTWDMQTWCDDRNVTFETIYPNYGRQREAFNELYNIVKASLFKAPKTYINGSKKEEIFIEEMSIFDHDIDKKWFGSPEKDEKYGIQDDCIYSVGWGVYGGRNLTADHFRIRKSMTSFGILIPNKYLVGKY